MKKMSNKKVALLAVSSWVLIALIAMVNGFMYGYPAQASVLPNFVSGLVGIFSLFMNIYAFVRLYKTSDNVESL